MFSRKRCPTIPFPITTTRCLSPFAVAAVAPPLTELLLMEAPLMEAPVLSPLTAAAKNRVGMVDDGVAGGSRKTKPWETQAVVTSRQQETMLKCCMLSKNCEWQKSKSSEEVWQVRSSIERNGWLGSRSCASWNNDNNNAFPPLAFFCSQKHRSAIGWKKVRAVGTIPTAGPCVFWSSSGPSSRPNGGIFVNGCSFTKCISNTKKGQRW